MVNLRRHFLALVSAALWVTSISPAVAGPALGPALGSDFTAHPPPATTPAYFSEGGWLVFTIPVVGDLLYACPPLGGQETKCKSVVLPIRGVGSVLERWFVDPESGSAWFRISAPPMGDFLLACFDPRGAPYCTVVDIEERPPIALLSLLGREKAGGLTGLLPSPLAAGSPTPALPERGLCCGHDQDWNSSRFWMVAALPAPGPVNLYSCGGLNSTPACDLAVLGLAFIEAEDFGLQKLSLGYTKGGADGHTIGRGIVIGGVATGSVAERAGLNDGDVVMSAAGFELLSTAHLKGLLMQVPVGDSIRLEVEGKGLIKLKREARR